MAKYFGRDGLKKGKIGREIYYYAFESNLVRECPVDQISPNTKKNINTKARFASIVKFTDYCMTDGLTKFFPDIKGAKMKKSSIIKVNKNNYLAMHKKYYKRSSLISFGDFKLPGNNETVLREDHFQTTIFRKKEIYHGLLVSYSCDYVNLIKIKQFSEVFLDTYPDFQEGDIIHCYGTFCENCFSKVDFEEPIEIKGNCNKKYIHRQLTINRSDNRNLEEVGFTTGSTIVDVLNFTFKIILVPICNNYKLFEADNRMASNPGSLFFWVESKNGGIHNKGGLLQMDTISYTMIRNSLALPATKDAILNSWKVIEYPIAAQ